MARPERLFLFQLALALGYAHPDRLLMELDSRQITEWMAFWNVSPFGNVAEDVRLAQVVAMIGNTHLRRGARAFRVKDFMLSREPDGNGRRPKRQSIEEQARAIRQIYAVARATGKAKG